MSLISRGFGALQRIISRGLFAAAPPSPDCYIGFNGPIDAPDLSAVGFVGRISSKNGFSGTVDATNAGFSGTISDNSGFNGSVC